MLAKRRLGRAGFETAEISLGAWQIGGRGYGPVPERDAFATIEAYLELGGDFIDTARGYGESERLLGEYFQRHGGRDKVFITSKTPKLEAGDIRAELETSLRLLQCDYVDLYYLHAPPDDPDEMNRALDTVEILEAEGKIGAIGASIKGPDVTQHTVDLCRQYIRSGRVDVLMVIYSITRQLNAAILAEAKENDVGIVARTVLESGFLSGKYQPGREFSDHRGRWSGEHLRDILAEVEALEEWAVLPPYENLAQVAIRFVLDQQGVSNVVMGARNAAQIQSSVAAAGQIAAKIGRALPRPNRSVQHRRLNP